MTATRQTYADFSVEPGESLLVEVLTDAGRPPTSAFPSRLTLNWRGVPGAAYYRIEEYVGGSWSLRARIRDVGQGYCRWLTRPLEDAATHQFRVVAVANSGNRGTATTLSALMVRHPDPQAVAYTWTAADRTLTLGAA